MNFMKYKEIENLEKVVDEIIKSYKDLKEENIALKKQISQTKEEIIQSICQEQQKENNYIKANSLYTFQIADNAKKIHMFSNQHWSKCHCPVTYSMGGDGFVFYISARCSKCNEEITVYE